MCPTRPPSGRPSSFSGYARGMRYAGLAAAAVAAATAAQLVREQVVEVRRTWPEATRVPYAPSATAAPYVTLGYRELGADLMWMRTLAYLGDDIDTADGMRALVEATIALDPWFKRAYDGGLAIESASKGVDNAAHLASVSILERAMVRFPSDWKYPYSIGQIYLVDLITTDPAEKRAWTERGLAMLERALRLPGTPAQVAALAAHLQKTLGRREAARQLLWDKIALTNDPSQRRILIRDLAELEQRDATELAIALYDERQAFEREWRAARPLLPALLYVHLGDRRDPYAPPAALATDRDLLGTDTVEPVEPLFEPEPPPAPPPAPVDAAPAP